MKIIKITPEMLAGMITLSLSFGLLRISELLMEAESIDQEYYPVCNVSRKFARMQSNLNIQKNPIVKHEIF
jgi:hypothetical protein